MRFLVHSTTRRTIVARVNMLDDPAVQAVVQKAVAEAVKAEQRRTKEILKDLRAKTKERMRDLADELRGLENGRAAGAIAVKAASEVDAEFKAAA